MDRKSDATLRRRTALVRSLPPLEEIVRGSLFLRRRRCGKPSCHCAAGEGHPTFYLAVTLASGKTEQISLPRDLIPVARQWVRNYRRVCKTLETVSAVNRRWIRKERRRKAREESI
jgi:hypothetical protein